MVEFCNACGTSLPKGDLSFKAGQAFTSHDYHCPECGKVANPPRKAPAADPEPEEAQELVFKNGNVSKE